MILNRLKTMTAPVLLYAAISLLLIHLTGVPLVVLIYMVAQIASVPSVAIPAGFISFGLYLFMLYKWQHEEFLDNIRKAIIDASQGVERRYL